MNNYILSECKTMAITFFFIGLSELNLYYLLKLI